MNVSESFFNTLALIGGLALFLYGMHVMGEGLARLSGGKMGKVLERLTDNPVKAVVLGAGVTAVIQSSSATTVTVVGFVNSGIMKLGQAVGVIMGANIGTTVTSWILSLTGIESSNFFVRLLKPTSFTPILAIIGIILIFNAKTEKRRDVGNILVGFSVLMFGMDAMSSAVKPLASVPEFTGILTMFSNPVLGMLAGTVLTAVIQSSSASIGILQALCVTGQLSYGTALPIILGQNIGTCVTALLSSVGSGRNAKRAALVHLYFNVIGTLVFSVAFYGLNGILHFQFLNASAGAAGIAVIHTVFNVGATLLLLPFSGGLEKLALLTVKESREERNSRFAKLDDRFLDAPALALEQAKVLVDEMAQITLENLALALNGIAHYQEGDKEKLQNGRQRTVRYEEAVTEYLHKIANRSLGEEDSEEMSMLFFTIMDFSRIAEHGCHIVSQSAKIQKSDVKWPKKIKDELTQYAADVKNILEVTVNAFVHQNEEAAGRVEILEDRIDQINKRMKKQNMKRLKKEKYVPEIGIFVNELSNSLERVADHCENIAVSILGRMAGENAEG